MDHDMKQIAEPIGITCKSDGTIDLRVRSTVFTDDMYRHERYPREWDLTKELLEITDPVHIMARLGLTRAEYDHWMAQLN